MLKIFIRNLTSKYSRLASDCLLSATPMADNNNSSIPLKTIKNLQEQWKMLPHQTML